MTFTILDVPPTGTRDTGAFVTGSAGCGYRVLTLSTYPPSPRGEYLRRLRCDSDPHVSLGEAGRRLGLGPAALSAIERGAKTFASVEEWERAIGLIRPGAGFDPRVDWMQPPAWIVACEGCDRADNAETIGRHALGCRSLSCRGSLQCGCAVCVAFNPPIPFEVPDLGSCPHENVEPDPDDPGYGRCTGCGDGGFPLTEEAAYPGGRLCEEQNEEDTIAGAAPEGRGEEG